ncbi:MAG: ion transporter [Sandaracinus sp.]|nr:ion transporter [Sandaracinus sp.]
MRRLAPAYVDPEMPPWWERLIILATLIAVGLLVYWEIFDLEPAVDTALSIVDFALCGLFVVDFAMRFQRARGFRWRFFRRHWIDLLGAIPFAGPLRAARFVRVLRILRLVALARRVVRRLQLPLLPTATFAYTFLVAAGVWLGAALLFFELERGHNENVHEIGDALWWSMTTLSTVGYGDLYPVTPGGRVVAVITMVVGVGVLGTLAATIATAFFEVRERGLFGFGRLRMRHHLLLLGWNDRSPIVVAEMKRDPRHAGRAIVVLADLERSPMEGIDFVRGLPSRAEDQQRAGAPVAAAALVFARDPRDARSDHETALTAMTFRRRNPDAVLAAELVDHENREHLDAAQCDAVVDGGVLTAEILVRAVRDAGVVRLLERLVKDDAGLPGLRRIEVGEHVGSSWRDTARVLLDRGVTAIAVIRDDEVVLTPDAAMKLQKSDELYVLGKSS